MEFYNMTKKVHQTKYMCCSDKEFKNYNKITIFNLLIS